MDVMSGYNLLYILTKNHLLLYHKGFKYEYFAMIIIEFLSTLFCCFKISCKSSCSQNQKIVDKLGILTIVINNYYKYVHNKLHYSRLFYIRIFSTSSIDCNIELC